MIVFLVLLVSLGLSAYLYATRNFGYWKKLGVFHLQPTPFVGNLGPIMTRRKSIGDFLADIYNNYRDQRFVGIYLADTPCLVVRDFELATHILVQDFNHFNNRILSLSKKTDYIAANSLFVLHGKEWKNTRAKVSPVFTSKKQKVIFNDMINVGNKLKDLLNKKSSIELKELSESIIANMVSDAVLGFDGHAIANPEDDKLLELGTKMFAESFIQSLKVIGSFLFPEIMITLGIRMFPLYLYGIMNDAVDKALKIKGINNTRRGDYIDALLEMRSKGSWEGNDGETIIPDERNMVAQLFMFFSAGFETAASALTYALYEVTKNRHIQDRIRSEYREILIKHNNIFSYEALNEMSYLNNFIQESLRVHPPFPFIDRICTSDYKIPGTNITIDKGVKVMLPLIAFHRDEMFYDNPMSIIPERFEDVDSMKEKPYMPFSSGPRICLGMRYGLQLIKIAVLFSIMDHSLTLAPNTPANVEMNPKRFGNTPNSDLYAEIRKLDD